MKNLLLFIVIMLSFTPVFSQTPPNTDLENKKVSSQPTTTNATVNTTELTTSNVVCTGGNWGSANTTFTTTPLSNDVFVLTTGLTDPNMSYAGMIDASFFMPEGTTGQSYAFGIINSPTIPDPNTVSPSAFDLTNKNGATGPITVNFSGVTNLDYVAYCGDTLIGYSYNGSDLTITFAATTAATSGNNITGGQVLFGMIIVTNAETDFDGAVFRTDMYWGDIAMQELGGNYGNTESLPGCNYYGIDGSNISFDYYIKQDVLENMSMQPVTQLDRCKFRFKKENGNELNPSKVVRYFTSNGNITSWGGNQIDGQSTFDFDGNGVDNYVNMHIENDSWSMANGYVYGDISTSIKTVSQSKYQISIVNNTINVQFEQTTNGTIKLINMSGQTLAQKIIKDSQAVINAKEKGIYILQLTTEGNSYSQQLVVF